MAFSNETKCLFVIHTVLHHNRRRGFIDFLPGSFFSTDFVRTFTSRHRRRERSNVISFYEPNRSLPAGENAGPLTATQWPNLPPRALAAQDCAKRVSGQ
jgi:hypothetical protein